MVSKPKTVAPTNMSLLNGFVFNIETQALVVIIIVSIKDTTILPYLSVTEFLKYHKNPLLKRNFN